MDTYDENGEFCTNIAAYEAMIARFANNNYTPKEDVEKVLRFMKASEPTDIIQITSKEKDELIKLWFIENKVGKKVGDSISGIPADIILSKTVPILDCRIQLDERELYKDDPPCYSKFNVLDFRCMIAKSYQEELKEVLDNGSDENVVIGAFVMKITPKRNMYYVVPIMVGGMDNCIGYKGMFVVGGSIRDQKEMMDKFPKPFLAIAVGELLAIWYTIQLSLLHPNIKTLFENGTRQKVNTNEFLPNTRVRKVKYVKVHKIELSDIKKKMYAESDEGGKKKIHMVLWRVIGHWRTYKNGKRIFIQPYWKGPARGNLDAQKEKEANEREIDINYEGGKQNE